MLSEVGPSSGEVVVDEGSVETVEVTAPVSNGSIWKGDDSPDVAGDSEVPPSKPTTTTTATAATRTI